MPHPPSTNSTRRAPLLRAVCRLACAMALSAATAALAQESEAPVANSSPALEPASAVPAAPATPAASTATPSPANATSTVSAPGVASTVSAPTVPPSEAGKLKPDDQVRWLRQAAQSGLLEKLDDADLTALFQSFDPLTVPRYVQDGPNGYPSYEFTMIRQERIRGVWPNKPDHMLVRVTRDPIRIYAKWLPDGAHAGQEIIYDETRRSDEMYGHLGGFLNIMPVWASLNGALAHTQSNHQVRDLGTEYIARQFLSEGEKYAQAGVTRPTRIEVKTLNGVRVVAFTYETSTGMPAFYAKRETLGLDLRHPYFRTIESYDNDGRIFERIVFQTITPKTFDDETFDPKNPAYRF
ncbi:DUF1571 domain-containing protein [Paraburkholderia rhizosphaerae]|uniref:Uncharacterized protein DUF1571 n=1 Tax=Paraburkholderia rhizosphaerae TaxID=480658 RepID=A0A4R8LI12_9BURK|nr:DUF1571 domain-containing protein [Paraburkholderia rhizosphaerae]TDY42925.1 uncharacterized protein DUF1571 [Paraburkholderia rhizosphaerae]